MRVISKFKDYYDGVGGAHTRDETPIYMRETREIPFKLYLPGGAGESGVLRLLKPAVEAFEAIPLLPFWKGERVFSSQFDTAFYPLVVVFCGRVYPFYSVSPGYGSTGPSRLYRDFHEVVSAVEDGTLFDDSVAGGTDWRKNRPGVRSNALKALEREDRLSAKEDALYRLTPTYRFNKKGWKAFQETYGEATLPADVHRHFKSPVFLLDRPDGVQRKWIETYETRHRDFGDHTHQLLLDPPLKGLSFAKIVEPFQAYQQLDMYLGNEMAIQADPPAPQTDVENARSHGFGKESFRDTHDERRRKQK